MIVYPIDGEPLVFVVKSETDPKEEYIVDLLANGGLGSCEGGPRGNGCVDFNVVCRPNQKRCPKQIPYGTKGVANPLRSRCKHIQVARERLCNDVIRQLVKEREDNAISASNGG